MPTDKPLVSILLASYNHECYVAESIASLLDQTYSNLELIVIDDGSTDQTFNILQKLKPACDKRFNRFVLLRNSNNLGLVATMNLFVPHIKGQYVYLTASDDRVKPDAIEKQINCLESNSEYGLCVGDNEFIDDKGKVCYWNSSRGIEYSRDKAKYVTHADFLQKTRKIDFNSNEFGSYAGLLKGNHIPNGSIIRSADYLKIMPIPKEAPLTDYWMMLQLAKITKFKFINEVLFSYRWHSSNTVHNKSVMVDMTAKTLDYEWNLVSSMQNKTWQSLMIDRRQRKKYLIKTSHLEVYKCKKDGHKIISIELII